jgi:hypothetical protein
MDEQTALQLIELHRQSDPLFARLYRETETENNTAKLEVSLALLHLCLEGKVVITQDAFGQLLFQPSETN